MSAASGDDRVEWVYDENFELNYSSSNLSTKSKDISIETNQGKR